jgi:hypothetical protein
MRQGFDHLFLLSLSVWLRPRPEVFLFSSRDNGFRLLTGFSMKNVGIIGVLLLVLGLLSGKVPTIAEWSKGIPA